MALTRGSLSRLPLSEFIDAAKSSGATSFSTLHVAMDVPKSSLTDEFRENRAPEERTALKRIFNENILHAPEGKDAGSRHVSTSEKLSASPSLDEQRITRTGHATHDTLEAEGPRIKTLDQLLEAAEVDLDVWRVKDYTANTWEQASVKRGILTMYQVKARLERIQDAIDLTALKDAAIEAMREHSPAPVKKYRARPKSGLLMEINVPDLHVGRLCHMAETGANYDGEHAIAAFRYVMAGFLEKAATDKVERIVFQVGQDLLHVDNEENTTTAGTRQDTDGRWYKSTRRAINLLVEAVDSMVQIAPVDLVIVPGNHARMQEQFLGEVLRAWYRNEDRVSVHDSPAPRKYLEHGVCLLGYTHGEDVKPKDLPLIMATEAPGAWSRTTFRTWSTGHLHQRKSQKWGSVFEDKGVEVRILPSLAANDSWHTAHGFIGNIRAAEASVYDTKRGRIASYLAVLPDDFTG